MTTPKTDHLPTRASRLGRLKDWTDEAKPGEVVRPLDGGIASIVGRP